MISRLCMLLEKVPWLRNRYYLMKKRMFLYYPKEEETVSKKAFFLCVKVWSVFLLGTIYFAITIHGVEEICLAICIFYMAYRYILSKTMEKESRKLLKEMEKFLGELRFQYSYSRNIEEAMEECLDRCDEMIRIHGQILLECLDDDELEEMYIEKAPIRFLKQLLVLCKSNFLYGDFDENGKSIFLDRVGIIKEAVEEELLKRRKIEYVFSGLLITCMLPIGCIPLIERWAISNMQDLEVYYYGTYGMVTTIVLCMITLFFYEVIRHMQYDEPVVPARRVWLQKIERIYWVDRFISWQLNRDYTKTIEKHHMLKSCGVKDNVKQFLMLQYVTAFWVFVVLVFGIIQYSNISRSQMLIEVEHMICNTYQVNEEQEAKLSSLACDMVTGKRDISMEELEVKYCSREVKDTVLRQIHKAKEDWDNFHLPWFIGLIPIIGAIIGYKTRYGVVVLKRRYAGLRREEEILTFQMVILCLMYAEQMTGEEVLIWLEKVAGYFKDGIERISYNLAYQNYEESTFLLEEEQYVPIVMILEAVMACDRLPVQEAFLQMESDYNYTVKKYIQECDNYIRDRSAICRVLAFAPLYLITGLKLIVPFVLEGLNQLSVYTESMKQLM